jgi:ABC-type glycerol-3-phosphate transport system permease component
MFIISCGSILYHYSILIAAFAAFGFAWLNFRGRKVMFTMVVALLVVPLQIAIVPVLQDFQSKPYWLRL